MLPAAHLPSHGLTAASSSGASVSLLVTFWNSGTDTFAGYVAAMAIVPWRELVGPRSLFFHGSLHPSQEHQLQGYCVQKT